MSSDVNNGPYKLFPEDKNTDSCDLYSFLQFLRQEEGSMTVSEDETSTASALSLMGSGGSGAKGINN
ncbi:hypothetical protein M3P05_13145 [Sansalvadorimonas sp. 2012CJ34-2]|uniref:Uncharacterized protein n=1 Tax=Parendozoicomonas callyspongiae TaxID=2942213 RepID=A0ABT0PHL9_9GAMM|nr:hypothetical protein [Sansalvadorimonas sp. 2012CJ34-2]MCL6270870.1 hypothetical protein [Sansalvadorimonas sp. 2012CJ34-2]